MRAILAVRRGCQWQLVRTSLPEHLLWSAIRHLSALAFSRSPNASSLIRSIAVGGIFDLRPSLARSRPWPFLISTCACRRRCSGHSSVRCADPIRLFSRLAPDCDPLCHQPQSADGLRRHAVARSCGILRARRLCNGLADHESLLADDAGYVSWPSRRCCFCFDLWSLHCPHEPSRACLFSHAHACLQPARLRHDFYKWYSVTRRDDGITGILPTDILGTLAATACSC